MTLTGDSTSIPQTSCCQESLGYLWVAFLNPSSPFPFGTPSRASPKVPGRLQNVSACTPLFRALSYVPSPCCSLAILDVEKGAYLGLEATFQDCWSNEERRTVDNVRREHCAETFGNDRGNARVKLRRDNMV